MIETIEYLKKILEKKIPYDKRGAHNSTYNITLRAAYRLIEEGKLDPLYKDALIARKALNKALTSSELANTIKVMYREETKYEDTPKIAVKWGNIVSEVESIYGIKLDRKKLHLYRNSPIVCECGERCELISVDTNKQADNPKLKWRCPKCGASVGVHKGTDIALGRPVPGAIGKKRIQVHDEINRLIDSGMSMDRVYRLLEKRMGLNAEQTHAGLFNEKQCEDALSILKEVKGKFNL